MLLVLPALALAASCGRRNDRGRVIVLGLDVMEPSVVETV